MTGAGAWGVTCADDARPDDKVVAAATAVSKGLRFAAAPTFLIMALLTAMPDRGLPDAFCSAAGNPLPGGMAAMYSLMSAFHLAPWLKLLSRRRTVARQT
jgi:hypothetical protein